MAKKKNQPDDMGKLPIRAASQELAIRKAHAPERA
jgi:hypothetical protein